MRLVRRFLGGALVAGMLMVMAAVPAFAETEVTRVPDLERIKSVAAAGDEYAALRADGKLFVWTMGAGGVSAVRPRQVEAPCPVRAMVPGAGIVSMLCADGTVWTAPTAADGGARMAQVRGIDSVKALALTRTHVVMLRTDGTVWVAPFSISEPGVQRAEQVAGLTGAVAIAGGTDQAVAITADGAAYRMAINTKGTSHTRVANLPPVRSVAVCGPDDDCDDADPYLFVTAGGQVLTRDVRDEKGTSGSVPMRPLDCAGCVGAAPARFLAVTPAGDAQEAVMAPDGRIIVKDIRRPNFALRQVAAGGAWDLGLTADGTVWLWAAPNGPARVPGLAEIRTVAAGGYWNLALGVDNRLLCWGSNDPAKRTHVIPHVFEVRGIVAASDYFVTLNQDGSLAFGQCPAPGAVAKEPIIHRDLAARWASAGIGHVIIIKFDGSVAALDIAIDEPGVHVSEARPVAGLEGAMEAAATDHGYLVLRADGTVWGARWGEAPAALPGISGARGISAGAVLLGDGSVRGIAIDEAGVRVWGDPHVDEGDGIAGGGGGGGSGGSLLVRADGTAVTFSRTVGAGQVTEIIDGIMPAAGEGEYLVLAADGTVWSWQVR